MSRRAFIGAVLAALVVASCSYALASSGTKTSDRGVSLLVALDKSATAVWYQASNPPPPITNRITSIARNLRPGSSVEAFVYVKNAGSEDATPSIHIRDLVDSGFTDALRLSSNIDVVVTYTSSLRPSSSHAVASGKLSQLAARKAAFLSPVSLKGTSSAKREIGMWRISVSLPMAADSRLQSQECSCSVVFGLAASGR